MALSFRGCLWTKEQKTERPLSRPGTCCFGLGGKAWDDILEVLRTGNPRPCPPAREMQMTVTDSDLGVSPGLCDPRERSYSTPFSLCLLGSEMGRRNPLWLAG